VLGPHVVVAEQTGLFDGQLEDALGARGKRNLTDRQGSSRCLNHVLHCLLDLFEIQVELPQHLGSDPLTLTDDSQEQVLGADVVVLEPAGLVTGEIDDFPYPVGEAILHLRVPS
jgi:hypothetical protein